MPEFPRLTGDCQREQDINDIQRNDPSVSFSLESEDLVREIPFHVFKGSWQECFHDPAGNAGRHGIPRAESSFDSPAARKTVSQHLGGSYENFLYKSII